jgi:hypothetical protein
MVQGAAQVQASTHRADTGAYTGAYKGATHKADTGATHKLQVGWSELSCAAPLQRAGPRDA